MCQGKRLPARLAYISYDSDMPIYMQIEADDTLLWQNFSRPQEQRKELNKTASKKRITYRKKKD